MFEIKSGLSIEDGYMSDDKRKVIKYKQKKSVSVGTVVLAVIFIYLISYMILYVTRDKISYYEVVYGTTAKTANKTYEGIIIRDEVVVLAESNGYVTHHFPDGSKTAVGDTVCSIDENGKIVSLFAESQNGESTLSQEDFNDIKNKISDFTQLYDNNDFDSVYAFKSEIQSLIAEKINYNNIKKLSEITTEDVTSYFKVSNAEVSGIVTYYTDGYEGKTYDTLTAEDFAKTNYKKVISKTNELVNTGTPIYKIVTSEIWGIVIPLDSEDVANLADRTRLEVRLDDSIDTYVFDLQLVNIGGSTYAKLTTKLNMINFIEQRFIDVKIENNTKTGLKIPKSSLVEKDFYVIPKAYGTKGGNSSDTGFMLEVYDENNKMTVEYVSPEIYSENDEYYYVSTQFFEDGDFLQMTGSGETYCIKTKETLKGVYNINNGYCIFREVTIIDENTDYYIVESGTEYGLLVYDHIVLDSSLVNEEDIVYR